MAETFLEAIGVMRSLGAEYFLAPLLVFTIVFAILSKTKAVSDKLDANAMIALILAFFVGLFPDASRFLAMFIPIMVMLLIIVFGGVVVYLFMGASAENIANFFKATPTVIFFIVMFVIIFGYTLSEVFPETYTAYQGGNESSYTYNYTPELLAGPTGITATIFHPKVLGTIVFLLLVAVAVMAIVVQPE